MELFPGRFLEEIDAIDIGRVEQALTAQRYAKAWERHHAPRGDARAIAAQLEAERRDRDRRMVAELVRLAVADDEKRVEQRADHQQDGAQRAQHGKRNRPQGVPRQQRQQAEG